VVASYADFLMQKQNQIEPVGFDVGTDNLNPLMMDWQRVIAKWSIRRGRAGIFLDTGLGKTLQQLVVADAVCKTTNGKFLLLTPLAVAHQTLSEARKFNIETPIRIVHSASEISTGINVVNYEKIHKFDADDFVGVGLDEGSILKSLDGKTRNTLIQMFRFTPYRFVFTATPSPNDLTEIGSYAEFLGIMSGSEMKAMYFTHDGGDTSKWRLRGHAEKEFFKWMATWAVMIRNPADIGYECNGYDLPEIKIHEHVIYDEVIPKGHLFQTDALTLGEQRQSRRVTIADRVAECAKIVERKKDVPWIIWCNLNDESAAAAKSIPGAVEITGSMKESDKERCLIDFTEGRSRVIVTKPEIAGFGLNWQHCADMAFLGLSHSYEQFYQAVRRSWRFGQQNPVNVHLVISDRDGEVLASIQRKQRESERLSSGMIEAMAEFSKQEILSAKRETTAYKPSQKMEVSLWR